MTMNVNSGKAWSQVDLYDLRQGLGSGTPIDQVADFLCRDVPEVHAKASQLGLLRKSGYGRRSHRPYAAHDPLRQPHGAKDQRPRHRTGRKGA